MRRRACRICALILAGLLVLAGCGRAPRETAPPSAGAASSGNPAQAAYSALLAGDRTLLSGAQSGIWVPDFPDGELEYEYVCLDLDGDGADELLVQMADDPCGYNAVFHYEEGRIFCWNSDAAEMSCRDYPLEDGTMVRQYDYSGARSYTVFRYQSDGQREELFSLFAREEPIPEDGASPYPWYGIGGEEVGQTEFDGQLYERITAKLLDRSAWTAVESRPAAASSPCEDGQL